MTYPKKIKYNYKIYKKLGFFFFTLLLGFLSLLCSTTETKLGFFRELQNDNDDRRSDLRRRSRPRRCSIHRRTCLGRCWSRGNLNLFSKFIIFVSNFSNFFWFFLLRSKGCGPSSIAALCGSSRVYGDGEMVGFGFSNAYFCRFSLFQGLW